MLLFESFNDIFNICRKYKIRNYTINPDGSIDVNGSVALYDEGLIKLPLKFNKVTGFFNCNHNQLTTLEGSPTEVNGDFFCIGNQLTTLEGSPTEVNGDFYCIGNQLTTLEGGPREVGGNFNCSDNQLTTLEGGPKEVGGRFNCYINPIHEVYKLFPDHKSFIDSLDYSYLRGTDIVRSRFKEALDEIGKEVPKSIDGYKYI
jgi:hypothetical protein